MERPLNTKPQDDDAVTEDGKMSQEDLEKVSKGFGLGASDKSGKLYMQGMTLNQLVGLTPLGAVGHIQVGD